MMNKKQTKFLILLSSLFSFLILGSCGSGTLTEIGVVATPLCVILPLSTSTPSTQDFCAAVSNTSNQNVSYEILNGDNFGTLGTVTDGRVTYTAPDTLPSSCVVIIQVTSLQDTSKSTQVSVLLGDSTSCPPPPSPSVCTAPVTPTCPPSL